MTDKAIQRDEEIQRLAWAFGTLKSAISTLNIGEDIQGCEGPVERASEAVKQQIERMRTSLDNLQNSLSVH